MSRPGRSIGPAGPPVRAPRGAARDVVERPQHRGDVAQRGVQTPALLDRPQRLALEVDDAIAVVGDQELAQVEVGVDPHHQRGAGHGLEPRHAGGDRRRRAAELRARRPRSTARHRRDRAG